MAGALLVLGISFAYTIETWWLAVEIPPIHLVGFVVVGLGLLVPITRMSGFRTDHADGDEGNDGGPSVPARSPVWVESLEAVFQAFLVSFVTLFLFGIISLEDPVGVIVRRGLVQVVPLAFGAALANEFLSGDQEEFPEASFPRSLGVFAMGAVFFSAPIAPTEEITILTEGAGWLRLGAVMVVTLLTSYLVLYELEFRGQSIRLEGHSRWRLIGQVCMIYTVGLLVSAGLLFALTDVASEPFVTLLRRTIVLAFPAGIGASAARVVLA